MNSPSSFLRYFLILLLGVTCLASGGIFVKLSEVGPVASAFYRILFAMPVAILWAAYSATPRPRTSIWNVPHGDFLLLNCAGIFLAIDLILWHTSFHYTSVANANLLANLVPFVVVPLSWLLFGVRPRAMFLLGLLVAVAGTVLLMAGKIMPSTENFIGDALAAATAVFYGLYLICVSRLRVRYNAGDILFWSGFSSIALLFVVAVAWEPALLPQSLRGYAILIALALLSHVGGQGLIAVSFERLPINFASVAVLLQPVIAALYALAIFAEILSRLEILGVGVILAGVYIAKLGSDSL